jgi:hypothetical protein
VLVGGVVVVVEVVVLVDVGDVVVVCEVVVPFDVLEETVVVAADVVALITETAS